LSTNNKIIYKINKSQVIKKILEIIQLKNKEKKNMKLHKKLLSITLLMETLPDLKKEKKIYLHLSKKKKK
jgi:hypothetical protein